ncbi:MULTISPECIES: UPF0489 family protein [Rhodococcus]|uniref:UPF0489 family protein n=1 Tax=Rhodococcus TaxID=1827 RepID=UPI001878B6C4|nr:MULTISPECIES: UPF0489 family protein [Rhodococcus]QOS66247.1 UPF0489 family protein [Rhodococcus qingshengii]
MVGVQRILDIDLDFFVTPVVYWPEDNERPPAEDYSVWPIDQALDFLRNRCGLTQKLPGFVTENHGELFPLWRDGVEKGLLKPPFHVTHVDAHADLGLGDSGYMYLMTSLLFEPPEERWYPKVGSAALNDGNFLLFATACRWIHDLTYVHGEGGGSDELFFAMKDFDTNSDHVQLAAATEQNIREAINNPDKRLSFSRLEPPVPYASSHWQDFQSDGPYDFICLTRSPPYAPSTADSLYDAIRETFIE